MHWHIVARIMYLSSHNNIHCMWTGQDTLWFRLHIICMLLIACLSETFDLLSMNLMYKLWSMIYAFQQVHFSSIITISYECFCSRSCFIICYLTSMCIYIEPIKLFKSRQWFLVMVSLYVSSWCDLSCMTEALVWTLHQCALESCLCWKAITCLVE